MLVRDIFLKPGPRMINTDLPLAPKRRFDALYIPIFYIGIQPGPTPEYECYDFNYTFTNGVQVRDPYGDRISDVRVLDGGSYAVGDYNVALSYNGSLFLTLIRMVIQILNKEKSD